MEECDLGCFIGTSIATGFVSKAASLFVSENKKYIEINMEQIIQVGNGGFIKGKSQ